jgi:DNA repair protein RadA/Sms
VGLTGEIRPVSFLETRVKEAIRQGFSTICLPAAQKLPGVASIYADLSVIYIGNIFDLHDYLKG